MVNQDEKVQSDPLRASSKNPQLFGNPFPETSGPQFGLEDTDSKKDRFRGWINKYGSSVILPIIALAILAGGIYLYTNQKNEQAKLFPEDNLAGIQEQLPNNSNPGIVADPDQELNQEIDKIVPQSRKEGNNIIEKAVQGEGITHLARRALKDYLKDNEQELTNEHKIYIEDYLKDKTGSQPLEVGEEITFSEDLIKEAIDASLELTQEQLKNLEQYSVLVLW